jgi:hypothetical protein
MMKKHELEEMKALVKKELVYHWGVYLYSVRYGKNADDFKIKQPSPGSLVGVDVSSEDLRSANEQIKSDLDTFKKSIFNAKHVIQSKWYQKSKENFCWHAFNPFFPSYKDYYQKSSQDKIEKLLQLLKMLNQVTVDKDFQESPLKLEDEQKKDNKALVQSLSSSFLYEWVSSLLEIVASLVILVTSVLYRINLAIQGEKPDGYFFSKDYFKELGLWFLESLAKLTGIYVIACCISRQLNLNKLINTLEKQAISIPKDEPFTI